MAKILKSAKKSPFSGPGLFRGGGFTSTPRGGALSPPRVPGSGVPECHVAETLQAAAALERAGNGSRGMLVE